MIYMLCDHEHGPTNVLAMTDLAQVEPMLDQWMLENNEDFIHGKTDKIRVELDKARASAEPGGFVFGDGWSSLNILIQPDWRSS